MYCKTENFTLSRALVSRLKQTFRFLKGEKPLSKKMNFNFLTIKICLLLAQKTIAQHAFYPWPWKKIIKTNIRLTHWKLLRDAKSPVI